MRRPKKWSEITEVSFRKSRPKWVKIVKAHEPGVHVILDGRNHWHPWSKVRRAR